MGGKKQGLLIAFEGIDGTGKTTQIQLLAQSLRAKGYTVVTTREPTEGPAGQRIRELFVSREKISAKEELELFLSDRRQHVTEVLSPNLAVGNIVLTDRYYLSTAAYQGAIGFDPYQIIQANEIFAPVPNLALIFDLPAATGVERIQSLRGEQLNAFEQETELRKVAEIFTALDFDYIRHIDASLSITKVQETIFEQVLPLLANDPATESQSTSASL